jgi:hypothetical protein
MSALGQKDPSPRCRLCPPKTDIEGDMRFVGLGPATISEERAIIENDEVFD